MSLQKGMVSSNTNEWATPLKFFEELDAEFHFTLDPCSTDENCKCAKHYTIADDGLAQDWADEVVFMNPPYGGNTAEWLEKALLESRKGATVVCLITSSTDRTYWHEMCFPYAAQIRFVRGRLKFGDGQNSAPFASAVVIFSEARSYTEKIVYYAESVSEAQRRGERQIASVSYKHPEKFLSINL
ncbi:hypothetical protein FACS1894208_02250 [Clostridia bacterium]|nr:hypothetical protein FACS1894208_02250 [Clostridia bacterium]